MQRDLIFINSNERCQSQSEVNLTLDLLKLITLENIPELFYEEAFQSYWTFFSLVTGILFYKRMIYVGKKATEKKPQQFT